MELVANVWPVTDESNLVLRYLMRAYAIEAPDAVISDVLRVLAETDYVLARTFKIPGGCSVTSEHGTLSGCIHIADFHEHKELVLAEGFAELENDFAKFQGISLPDLDHEPVGIAIIPKFPKDPYLVTTPLFETQDGKLIPESRRKRAPNS